MHVFYAFCLCRSNSTKKTPEKIGQESEDALIAMIGGHKMPHRSTGSIPFAMCDLEPPLVRFSQR